KNTDSAELDAEVLLAFILGKNKEYLFTYPEKELTKIQLSKFLNLIKKRATGEPVAYLIGEKEFFGLKFFVNKNVLIPRPETELLVEEILKVAKDNMTIADIGTGSGAILIAGYKSMSSYSAKKRSLRLEFMATDISKKALAVAKKNAEFHKANIKFFQGDLLEPVKNKQIDIMTANLPYLEKKDKKNLRFSEEIGLKFEPKQALYSGKDGLDAYREFFKQVAKLSYQPKFILIEFGYKQTAKLEKIIRSNLNKIKIHLKKDLGGFDRVMVIELFDDSY
ncbi:protein-(glutamine-N5) methyltransferase, release factor-specific, partial [Candidatus Falkowbacteria bacterium RIFOXYD2_FULL_35_9]